MRDEIGRLSDELAGDPSSKAFLPLAEALCRKGQMDLALQVATRGLARHPDVVEAHDLLARIFVNRGDLRRAASSWRTALRLDPKHRGAKKGLGFVAFRQASFEEAEQHLSELATVDPADASVAAALAHVRRAREARGPAAPRPHVEAPVTGAHEPIGGDAPRDDARTLFDSVLSPGERAVLLDADGLVLAGTYPNADGIDVADEVGTELALVGSEAERAVRYLDLGAWCSIVIEAEGALVAMSPAARGGLLLVTAPRGTAPGLVRPLLTRVAERAYHWLSRFA